MKADPADRFGIGEDAGLDGFVLAGDGHLRSRMGGWHGAHSRSDSAQSLLRTQPGWPSGSAGECLEQAVQELAASDELLGQDQTFQKLRREVGTIRPADGAQLRIHVGLFEVFRIQKLCKDGACQLCRQVDFALGAIVELKGETMS